MSVNFSIPALETERLRLRLPKISDLPTVNDFRVSERSRGVGGPFKADTGFSYLAGVVGQWHLRGYGRWIVTEKDADAPLGLVGIYHPDDWPEAEIGWTIFGAAEGKGYALEAANFTRDYAYQTLGWDRIISSIMADNHRSIKLAKRMGATNSGDSFTHPEIGTLDIWVHAAPQALT